MATMVANNGMPRRRWHAGCVAREGVGLGPRRDGQESWQGDWCGGASGSGLPGSVLGRSELRTL